MLKPSILAVLKPSILPRAVYGMVLSRIAPMLGIEKPQVMSGSYSEATITTALTAAAKAKGAAQESTAAVLTPATASPSANLGAPDVERQSAASKLLWECRRPCIDLSERVESYG